MRKQFHLWPSENGVDAWDVERLVTLTAGSPVEQVAVADIPEIDTTYWFDDSQRPTVRSVVEHCRLIAEVDLSHPIILGPGNRVMDGMHRIARALLEKIENLPAVRLAEIPEPDFHDVALDELTYD
jgi:hypothetical protein